MTRGLAIFLAFISIWFIYMAYWVIIAYEPIGLFVMPLFVAILSAIVVSLALLAGLILKIPPLQYWWTRTSTPARSLAIISLFMLCLFIVMTPRVSKFSDENEKTGQPVSPADATIASIFWGSYFGLAFAIANWPMKKKQEPEPITLPSSLSPPLEKRSD